MYEQITVSVDESLSDLIPGFLERKRIDILAVVAAVASGDFVSVRSIAHRLKGEGGAYGFGAITELARAIEQSLAANDYAAVKRYAAALLRYIDNVQVVFHPSED